MKAGPTFSSSYHWKIACVHALRFSSVGALEDGQPVAVLNTDTHTHS